MLQRFLNVPATPSYVGSAGGVVLDRVCTAFGARPPLRVCASRPLQRTCSRSPKPFTALHFLSLRPHTPACSPGGANWWGTVTGRLRAQSVWNKPSTREGKPHRCALDPLPLRSPIALCRTSENALQ